MENTTPILAESPAPLLSLEEALSQVPDMRPARGIRYKLRPLLTLVMLTRISDADTPIAIADWAAGRADWVREHLQLNWRRMPHHSTFRRLLQKLSLPGLREQAQAFLVARLSPEKRLYHQDGQALLGTIAGEDTDGRPTGGIGWRFSKPGRIWCWLKSQLARR